MTDLDMSADFDGRRHPADVVGGLLVMVVIPPLLVMLAMPFVMLTAPQLAGASHSYVVTSDAMAGPPAPAIETGDVVFVYETPPEQLTQGDVITYRSEADQLTTRRIVEVRTAEGDITFETRGDANRAASPHPVPAEQVVGTVTPPFLQGSGSLVIPYLGYVVLLAQTPRGIGALAAVPLFLLIATNRRRIITTFLVAMDALRMVAVVPARTCRTVVTVAGDGSVGVVSRLADAGSDAVTLRTALSVEPERGRRLLYAGTVLALALVVLPFVVFAVPQLVGASNTYVVVSDSMAASPEPVLQAGDVVFVYETPPERIKESDVITYRRAGGQVTTHRVVEVQNTEGGLYFETKGDANEEADSVPVPAERVIGQVRFSLPVIGHVLAFAGTTHGFVLLVVVPVLLLVATETWEFAAGTRSSDAESADTGPDTADPGPPGQTTGAEFDGAAVETLAPPETGTDESAESADRASNPVRYTLTRMDLRLTLLVLTTFGVYSTVIAFFTRRVWATMVATTALASLALFAGLYYWGGWGGETKGSPGTAGGSDVAPDQRPIHSSSIVAALQKPGGPDTGFEAETDSEPTEASARHTGPGYAKAYDSEHGLRTHHAKQHGTDGKPDTSVDGRCDTPPDESGPFEYDNTSAEVGERADPVSHLDTTRPTGRRRNGPDNSTAPPGIDYAERGVVEKTAEELLEEDIDGIAQFDGLAPEPLVTESGELTVTGRLFVAGLLTGRLGTIRVFDGVTEVTPADGEEIMGIVDRREAAFVEHLMAKQTTTHRPNDG